MSYTTRSAEVTRRIDRAIDAALIAAALVYENRMKKDLMSGYTTGDYSHKGQGVAGSVAHTKPETIGDARVIRVGTNISYAAYWEFGFVPARGVFSPGMGKNTEGPIPVRRVEKWRPALLDESERMKAKFYEIFDQKMRRA